MLKRILVLVGLLVIALTAPTPGSASDADTIAEIKAADEALKVAFIKQDGATIRKIMTPDGILATPFYRAALSTDQVVSRLKVWKIKSHKSHNINVTPLGPNTGLMTLYTSFVGTFEGKPVPPWVFATGLWIKLDGVWRLKLYQETAVNKP